jgi:pyruvate,water dikinase
MGPPELCQGKTRDGSTAPQEPDLLDLADIGEEDLPLVGGKAYRLGLMAKAGLPVPRGFVVTTAALRNSTWLPSGGVEIPRHLAQRIIAAYRERGFRRVAVRSSATCEDLSGASFAGIYASRLVASEEGLLAAVEEGLLSFRTPAADFYRRSTGLSFDEDDPGMAIVVQEMVDAQVSGVMYTLNPLTFDRQEVLINAIFGLCDPLVSGRVSGDTFRVERTGHVLEERVHEKTSMLTSNGEIPIPEGKRNLPTLASEQIPLLVEQGLGIEALFGSPQDIEFALTDGKIYVLQARPIPIGHESLELKIERYRRREIEGLRSRIADLRRKGKLTCGEAVYSDGNIGEILPTPTPMSFGIFTSIFADEGGIQVGRRQLGYVLGNETSEGMFELICGHPYFTLEIDARTFHIGIPLDIQGYVEKVKGDRGLANYPELGLYEQGFTFEEAIDRFGLNEGTRHYKRFVEFLTGMRKSAEEASDRFYREVEPVLQRYLEQEREVDPAVLPAEGIIAKIHSYIEHLKTFSCVQFVIAARLGFFFTERVKQRMAEFFPGEGEGLVGELLRGLEPSRIGQQAADLQKLVLGELSQEGFLAMYGHLAANELEISLSRIADDPKMLAQLAKDFTRLTPDPSEGFREQAARRQKAEQAIRARLEQKGVDPVIVGEFFQDLKHAQRYLPLRETIKYYIVAEYALIRKVLTVLAEERGLSQDDIFYLYPHELPELLTGLEATRETIGRRKEERRLALLLSKQQRMPKVIFESLLEEIGRRPRIESLRQFHGIPVSSGEAVGTVRILALEELDFAEVMERLREDDVIVMRAANLGMFPIIRNIAGLILETGGILAHGACLARERGIPAVVLEHATSLLPEGGRVRIDGTSGDVFLLS